MDLVSGIGVLASVITIVLGAAKYLGYAQSRFWWPFTSRLPIELRQATRKQLTDVTRICPYTRAKVTFLATKGNSLWLLISFRQATLNISEHTEVFNFRFQVNGRKMRNLRVLLDKQAVAPSRETDSEILISSNLAPDEQCELEVQYEMEYHVSDSELFVTYRPGLRYEFILIDEVSERAGVKKFALDIDQLLSPSLCSNISEYENKAFSRHLQVEGGLLPGSGIYLKWRPVYERAREEHHILEPSEVEVGYRSVEET